MQIDKSMTIGDLISINQGIIVILMNNGMHCVGCPSSIGESLEEACMVHGLKCDPIVNEINEFLADLEK